MNLELVAALPKPPGFFDPQNPAGLPPAKPEEDSDESSEEAESSEARLAFQPSDDVVSESYPFERRAEHELSRMKNERFIAIDLDECGEVELRCLRVDVRVLVILEDTKEAIDSKVDTGRLQIGRLERIDLNPATPDGLLDSPV